MTTRHPTLGDTVNTPAAHLTSVALGEQLPPAPGSVLDWYLGWVRRTPDAVALLDGDHHWTYAQLDRLADSVADALRERVRPGELVGVCLDHSAALVAVTLAVAKLGAVHLPLGRRPGERRLQAVAQNLRLACLVGDPSGLPPEHRAAEQLPLPVPLEGANAGAAVVAAFAPAPAGAVGGSTDAHYAVLTSGSTGTPKAVAVGPASLGALLRWYRELTGLGPGDRHSLVIGVAFDPHVMELWAALTSGAALAVAPDEVRWDPGALTDWWREAGVTVSVLPTPLAEPVLDRPWPPGLTLRHLMVGGDRLRRSPSSEVTAAVHNAYGPAEATVVTSVHTMPPGDPAPEGPPPIGLPVAGAVVRVTDESGEPLPRGEAGELRVGGGCLALGYLDEELTARRFVTGQDGERFYRTGDRVLMRPDGVLEFLGRLDDQVKVSGVRIEPAEVEAAFERDARVRRAAVAARRNAAGGVQLVAFLHLAPGESVATADLLTEAREWLPEQAVPTLVRVVEAFPLDANGKVDRAALLAEHVTDAVEPTPGHSSTEETVLGLCRGLLGRPDLRPQDNFRDVGGNSLAAARLLVALEQAFGVRLRAPQLLRQPDLRSLAELVEARRPSAATAS